MIKNIKFQKNKQIKSTSESPWTENESVILGSKKDPSKLNGDLVLNFFNDWLEQNRYKLDSFDHAFGVTA